MQHSVEHTGPEELHKQEVLQDIQQGEGRSQKAGQRSQPCWGRKEPAAAGTAAAVVEGKLLLLAVTAQ